MAIAGRGAQMLAELLKLLPAAWQSHGRRGQRVQAHAIRVYSPHLHLLDDFSGPPVFFNI